MYMLPNSSYATIQKKNMLIYAQKIWLMVNEFQIQRSIKTDELQTTVFCTNDTPSYN